MVEIDKDSVRHGDSIRWRNRRGGPSWGTANYGTADALHVEQDRPGDSSKFRYAIPWERVTGHWPGREAYDRARGALTDHTGVNDLRGLLHATLSRYSPQSRGESLRELGDRPALIGYAERQIKGELQAMIEAGEVTRHKVRGTWRYVPAERDAE